ncbi:MAG: hypothetical protein ACTHNT_07080 [Actinomycetales bacterium]
MRAVTNAVIAGLLAVAVIASVPAWRGGRRRGPRRPLRKAGAISVALPVVVLAVAAAAGAWSRAAGHGPLAPLSGSGLVGILVVCLLSLLAVAAGGPVTTLVLELADRSGDTDVVAAEPPVLRGGAWIGALERAAIVTTLLAGWPEGLAVVLGIKGLARYPELRAPAAAERFIIGTFTSVLWAAACAGCGVLLTVGR